MSVDADRDLSAELASPKAGHLGIPADALCTGCQRTHVKRARPEEVGVNPDVDPITLDVGSVTSFKHVCYRCGTVTWWNPEAVLTGLIEANRERGE